MSVNKRWTDAGSELGLMSIRMNDDDDSLGKRVCFGMHVKAQKKGNHCLWSSNTQGMPGQFSRPGSLSSAFITQSLLSAECLFHSLRCKDLLHLTVWHTNAFSKKNIKNEPSIISFKLWSREGVLFLCSDISYVLTALLTFKIPKYLFKFLFCPEVLEEWTTQTSYDMGLETEKAALEKLETQNLHQEQVTTYSISTITCKVSKKGRLIDNENNCCSPTLVKVHLWLLNYFWLESAANCFSSNMTMCDIIDGYQLGTHDMDFFSAKTDNW